MKRQAAIRWLYDELPALISAGVVDETTASGLRRHYGELQAEARNVAMIVCAVLGTVLVGGGVILLLAHNWEQLSRPARTVIALTPLISAVMLSAWVLWRRSDSAAWREGSAILWAAFLGSALAIIDQSYHGGGDLASYLMRWCLLVAPVPWLMRSSATAALYVIGLTVWAGAAEAMGGSSLWYWPMLLAVAPVLLTLIREHGIGRRSVNLLWIIVICAPIATGINVVSSVPDLWIVAFTGLFALFSILGWRFFDEPTSPLHRPLQAMGAAGTVVMAVVLSYSEVWEALGWSFARPNFAFDGSVWFGLAAAVAIPAIILAMLVHFFDPRQQPDRYIWAASPLIAGVVYPLVAGLGGAWIGAVAFNLVLMGLGVFTMLGGLRNRSLAKLNGGMLVLSALIVARFFDAEIDMVLRGAAFILVGAGFLVSNLILSRRLRAEGRA